MLDGKKLTLLFLGLGGWKFHQMAIFASNRKKKFQIQFFWPPTTHFAQAVMLGGKKLTLLFLGLGGWKFHQMAIFAIRLEKQFQLDCFCPLPPNSPRLTMLGGKNLINLKAHFQF